MDTPQFKHDIAQLRAKIDDTDAQLMTILARRLGISTEIGRLKRAHGLPIFDAVREQELIDERGGQAAPAGLPQDWTVDLFKLILVGCRSISSAQLNSNTAESRTGTAHEGANHG